MSIEVGSEILDNMLGELSQIDLVFPHQPGYGIRSRAKMILVSMLPALRQLGKHTRLEIVVMVALEVFSARFKKGDDTKAKVSLVRDVVSDFLPRIEREFWEEFDFAN